MNADALVHVLLELNVINVQDIDQQINKLAARVSDPRAQQWVRRCVRYWLINIEQLKSPYTATAEPRGHYGSKYNIDPQGSWTQAPEQIAPEKKGKWWNEKPFSGTLDKCPQCSGSGKMAQDDKGKLWAFDPEHPIDDLKVLKCPRCKGTGKHVYVKPTGSEGVFTGEALLRYFLEAERGEYDPEKRTYTTGLRYNSSDREQGFGEPIEKQVDRDINSNFRRFYPKKAKAAGMHGEPPTKDKLQPWMTAPDAKKKEFHHFDPIQVKRRDLFSRLEMLIHYLNHLYVIKEMPLNAEMPEVERQRAEANKAEAEKLFQSLGVMKPDDINGFRSVLKRAEEFGYDVKEKPWLFSNDGKTIATHGRLSLRKTITPKTCQDHACKPTFDGQRSTVCLRDERAKSYITQGPVYFVDKDDKTYVCLSFPGSQVHTPQNNVIDSNVAQEIAPLFVKRVGEFPIQLLAQGGAGGEYLAKAVEALRKQANIR